MNHPVISIIVPVYNVEKYICRCLDSLLEQNSDEYEIITVDDGSLDNSGLICDEFAQRYNVISSYHKDKGGVSSARNLGILKARGEWICFVDSDDWVEPNFISECLKILANYSNCNCISFGYYIDYTDNNYSLDRKYQKTAIYLEKDIPQAIITMEVQGMLNVVWNKLYKADLIFNNQISFDESVKSGEDLIFNCRYFGFVDSCVLLQNQLYHYMRQGETTLTKKYDPELINNISLYDCARVELYNALHMDSQQYQQYIFRYYYSYVMSALYNNYSEDSQLNAKDRRCFLHWLFHDERFRKSVVVVNGTSNRKSAYEAVFSCLYEQKNAIVSDYVYRMLFWLRNHMKDLYNRFRARQLTR